MIGSSLILRLFSVLAVIALLTGCKSRSPAQYVSPRIVGRVLDEQSRQPIKGVLVKRVVPDYEAGTLDQVHGAESLARTQPIRTDASGAFDLASQKSVALFREVGWFGVEIAFEHRAYETFTTNYTPASSVLSANGEPVIHAGDIWLTPKSK
jgi:hypothetical protein